MYSVIFSIFKHFFLLFSHFLSIAWDALASNTNLCQKNVPTVRRRNADVHANEVASGA